jgi:cytochrome c oxidase subunit 2
MEIAWTVGSFLVLAFIFVATVSAMNRSQPTPLAGQQPDLLIVGHQFWWEARYTQSHVITANEVHVPEGRRLLVRLESADVIHDWWVPELGPKMDAIPGQSNFLWLEADSPGEYRGTCAEFCGAEHAWMRILVVAQSEADYQNWIAQQLQHASQQTAGGDVQHGAELFQQRACSNCHAIRGTAATATIGPDLTHVATRETLAAGVLENTQSNLEKWISDPQAVKPGAYMPKFQFSPSEIHDLTAYLETLR